MRLPEEPPPQTSQSFEPSESVVHYLVAPNSLLRYKDSAVATHELLDIATKSGAQFGLVRD